MLAAHEKRRKEPSYTIPFLYEMLEIMLIWVVFSLLEGSMNISTWTIFSYVGSGLWFLYTIYKLRKVLIRQTIHKW